MRSSYQSDREVLVTSAVRLPRPPAGAPSINSTSPSSTPMNRCGSRDLSPCETVRRVPRATLFSLQPMNQLRPNRLSPPGIERVFEAPHPPPPPQSLSARGLVRVESHCHCSDLERWASMPM